MPARVLYAGQEVKIVTNGGLTRYLPVQSASCEVTRPIEDILSFGKLGSLGRVQNNVSTCKADIKSYLANTTGSTGAGAQNALVNSAFIQGLTGEALAGSVSVISVSPNGFFMSGILANFGVDIANGAFGTADFSFVGVGEPNFAPAPSTTAFGGEATNMPSSFSPVVSTNVTGQTVSGCATSFKFSLDIPNEVVSCLGGVVSGTQPQVASSFVQVAKPPFKASISVEGIAVDSPNNAANTFVVGKLGIALPAAQVTSRSFNNAVGQVGATYNYTLEDVTALFTDQP
jgi:hypothetical protein